MNKLIRKIVILIFVFGLVAAFFIFWSQQEEPEADLTQIKQVCFENECFQVELAQTDQERAVGLMDRQQLDLNQGMLFIFESEHPYSFWMKNVLIPLDLIFLNQAKEVVAIIESAQPCLTDLCPSLTPDQPASYVLEINGGLAKEKGIQVGQLADF